MLVETGLPYEPHLVSLTPTTRCRPRRINPNNKIPPSSTRPGGHPLRCPSRAPSWSTGRRRTLHAQDPAARYQTLQG